MFGIDKITKRLNAMYKLVELLTNDSRTLKNHIKTVQSTNDKRYNEIKADLGEIGNEISLIKTVQEAHHSAIKNKDLVKCDKCRCLLEKKDAIKGESRIVKHFGVLQKWEVGHWPSISFTGDVKEEIKEVFLCHKCGGKNDTKTKSNRVSKKGSKKTR